MAFALLLGAGAALRLWQYFGRSSLWLDELALVASILERPVGPLVTEPLLYDQTAPPGFLAAVKLATFAFGDGELALRLVPLLGSLIALFLVAAVARRLLGEMGAWFATAMFALGPPFIRYAAEAKPYATDVTIALILTGIALRLPEGSRGARPFWAAGLIGAAAVWFSQPAVFVLAGLGAALIIDGAKAFRSGAKPFRSLLPTLGCWGLGSTAAVLAAILRTTPSTRELLREYWEPSFPDVGWRKGFGVLELLRDVRSFWGGSGMGYAWPTAFLVLTVFGFALLWRRRRLHALILIGPILVTFAASAARLYPWDTRLVLFLGPAFILGAAAGASGLIAGLGRLRIPAFAVVAVLVLPVVLAIVRRPPVYRHEETRPLFEYLAEHREPDDAIYVFHGAAQALRYYGPRNGIDERGAVVGGCHRTDPAAYLPEIDAFRGRPRVWILIARSQRGLPEQSTIRAYAGRIGRRLEGTTTADGDRESTLELFDFSDPATLDAASSATFPIPSFDPVVARRFPCGRGPGAAAGGM